MERLWEKWPCSLGPMLPASRRWAWARACRKEIKESLYAMLELHCPSLGPEELPLGILPSHHLTAPSTFRPLAHAVLHVCSQEQVLHVSNEGES